MYNVTKPMYENITLVKNGFYYTPFNGNILPDYFNYTVSDYNTTVSSTITINIKTYLHTAVRDNFIILKYKVSTLDVLANDYDSAGDPITIIINSR